RKNVISLEDRENRKALRVGSENAPKDIGFNLNKKTTLDKSERLPKEELIALLFSAFAEYPYWTFKALIERIKQPQTWLREVLTEVASLQKKGPYNGMYALKPEFGGVADAGVASSTGGGLTSGEVVKAEDEDEEMGDDEEIL
ncbi:hypothetical protein HDV05_007233, partial [Chytridiales sp. JEL 0842]